VKQDLRVTGASGVAMVMETMSRPQVQVLLPGDMCVTFCGDSTQSPLCVRL
jgi:hypothetical protein